MWLLGRQGKGHGREGNARGGGRGTSGRREKLIIIIPVEYL